jgi:hypothetical protein
MFGARRARLNQTVLSQTPLIFSRFLLAFVL